MDNDLKNKLKGLFFGAVIGDVYGAPYEFNTKDYMEAYEDEYKFGFYSSGGPFNLPKGYYTDDTSMMLCLGQSLIDSKGTNKEDQILKYIDWYLNGYMSSNGRCFDIGTQTRLSLEYYITNKVFFPNVKKENSSGNGALMRIAPIPVLFYHPEDIHNISYHALTQTQVTHDNYECNNSSITFCLIIRDVLNQYAIDVITNKEYFTTHEILHYHFRKLFDDNYEAIGSGYVKDSIYIALESVLDSENFIDAIIKTIDYGYDTDTNACITGMLAGLVYGFESIEKNLVKEIKDCIMIEKMFEELYKLRDEI